MSISTMDELTIEQCTQLIILYKKGDDSEIREKARHELFSLMHPWMERWVSSILLKMGRYEDRTIIRSLSWDCYVYCLNKYKQRRKSISIPGHFYTYSKYYIMNESVAEQERPMHHSLSETGVWGAVSRVSCPPSNLDAKKTLHILGELRSSLPDSYQIVFDDALMSINAGFRKRPHRVKESGLSYYSYHEAKRLFGFVILFLKNFYEKN